MSSPVSCEHSRPGRLIIYSGPSGVGKGTILKQLLDTDPQLWLSVSVTTRQPRPGETDGVHYHFISQEAYDRLVKEDGMLEHAVYSSASYGTPRRPVEEHLAAGCNVVLEIDVYKRQVKGYLAVLARRRAVDCYRRLAGKPPADSLDREDLPEADSPPAEDFSRQSLDRQVLLEALGELGEPDREILIRRYYLGQSAREIGRAVGMRPNTVDKRVERSLEKLRRQMRAEE